MLIGFDSFSYDPIKLLNYDCVYATLWARSVLHAFDLVLIWSKGLLYDMPVRGVQGTADLHSNANMKHLYTYDRSSRISYCTYRDLSCLHLCNTFLKLLLSLQYIKNSSVNLQYCTVTWARHEHLWNTRSQYIHELLYAILWLIKYTVSTYVARPRKGHIPITTQSSYQSTVHVFLRTVLQNCNID